MKKLLLFAMFIAFIIIILISCEKEEENFDASLLTGKWQSGTLFERYFSNGDGYTWDTVDDVQEEEAQHFTWTLTGSTLTQIHIMELGATPVPRVYTVTELTPANFEYKNLVGKNYRFIKAD
jgi:hypothetical protein